MAKRACQLVFLSCVLAGSLWAADEGFVGKWKLDPSRSKLTDRMKVDGAGPDTYVFDFGGGTAETIVADGSDHPGNFGTTLCVTIKDPRTWNVVRKKDGRMVITAIWNLSEDGKTLTDHYTEFGSGGAPFKVDYAYQRTAGSSGFVGTWESTIQQVNAFELEIHTYEVGGLSFINPAEGVTKNINFDGKDYPSVGPYVAQGSTSSGSRMNQSSLELTDKVQGKVTAREEVKLSDDSKTLTMTVRPVGQSKPNILTFNRE